MKSETLKFITKSFAIIALMAIGIAASAQTHYVFYNATYGYICNNNGTVSVRVAFDESCIWTANNALVNTSNSTIRPYGDASQYLRWNNSTLQISETSSNFRGSSNYLCRRRSGGGGGGSNNYIRYNGSTFSAGDATDSGNDRFTYYQVTITNATTPTFSISYPTADAYVGSVDGTISISASVSGNYRPKYYNFNSHYYLEDGTDYGTSAPSQVSNYDLTYELVGECADYATISGSTVTYTEDAGHDVIAQVKVTAKPQGYPNVTVGQETCSFVLRSATIAAPTITRIEGTNQYQIMTTAQGASIKYTIDGTDIDEWASNGTTYSGPITVTTDGAVIKAKAVREGKVSDQTAYTVDDVVLIPPTITISDAGVVTITNPNTFASSSVIRYTTDGSIPTASSPIFSSCTATNMQTIKAIVTATGYDASPVASAQFVVESGVSGGVVTLNDYEDHNWAYYKGRDIKVGTASDAPNYKDKYKYTLYSPDPRNVKITYRGYDTKNSQIVLGSNTVATSTLNTNTTPHVSNATGEGQNTFVYYKTLEKFVIGYFTDNADWNGKPDDPSKENYPYTVISNPFSVRPSTGSGDSKKYYGFAGWKIISGGKYIGRGAYPYTPATDGAVLGLDELIHFVNLDADVTYSPNCTSAEIVLEATWTEATVWSGNTAHAFTGKTYETNFIVASGDITSIEQGSPCTIIGMNPDGTGDNSGSRTITGLKVTTTSTTDPYSSANTVKVEWIRHGSGTFNANGRNMTLGRGITSSNGSAQGTIYGVNSENTNAVNTVKVESGYFNAIASLGNNTATSTTALDIFMVFGCDYDRSLANYYVTTSEAINSTSHPYNTKLRVRRIYGAYNGSGNCNPELNRSQGQLYIRSLFKSGIFAQASSEEYYFHSYQHWGQRYIEMEGGYNRGHIKGGSDGENSQEGHRSMSVRMKGGRIDGQIGCGSTSTYCSGDRVAAITGGYVGGWIAPGSNCQNTNGTGVTDGESFVYFGGTAEINSRQFETTADYIGGQSYGGVIYGAGLGYGTNYPNSGKMTYGSNIVFADEAYCERGIYGGGALGQTYNVSNIFILGGRVGKGQGYIKSSSPNSSYPVESGVYGGACYTGGENSFIYMDDGIVESGIYGGSNINGSLTGNATIQINGGQVGYIDANANVHGGGYGNATRVLGSVNVTVGKSGATDGATIYGDVYGGSAEGKTNGDNARTTDAVTNVTLNAGTVNGNVYGGGLGTSTYAADVWGPVTVTVTGGEAQNIFGCNNTNGAPKNTVDVNMTGGLVHECVYGGGNAAAYTGNPKVTISGGEVDKHVFGGGLGANAVVTGNTDVKVTGSTTLIKGNVYGGGNAAKVTGNTNVTMGEE